MVNSTDINDCNALPAHVVLLPNTQPVGRWAGTVAAGSRVVNPRTGVTVRTGARTNPWTGTTARGARVYNPWTGRTTTAGMMYNPWLGQYRWGDQPVEASRRQRSASGPASQSP